MNNDQLFFRSRLKLAIVYSGVIGAILLFCGFSSLFLLKKAFNRTINRELNILARVFESKFDSLLEKPAQFPPTVNQILPGLCFIDQPCEDPAFKSDLFLLLERDYYFRFLDPSGKEIAAPLKGNLGRFPDHSIITQHSGDVRDSQGELYHLHLLELKTNQGEIWGYIQVGVSLKIYSDYINTFNLLLAIGIPLAMILISFASWYLAGLAMNPIEKSYRQMQRFTADVAHELRTPLASAQIILEIILDNPLFSEERPNLNKIERSIKRLGELTKDLLLLSKLEQNLIIKQWDSICLNDLVQDVEEELISLALEKNISLSCEIETDQLLYIQGNEDEIYRLLLNLVNNAIKYNKTNGQVTIRLKENNHQVIIEVEDTGMGIPPTDIPYIFDRFYRVKNDRSRATGGTGLGLAIAQAIVQNHKGYMIVKSEVEKGSLFAIYFFSVTSN